MAIVLTEAWSIDCDICGLRRTARGPRDVVCRMLGDAGWAFLPDDVDPMEVMRVECPRCKTAMWSTPENAYLFLLVQARLFPQWTHLGDLA